MEGKTTDYKKEAAIPLRQKRNYLEIIYDLLSSIPEDGIKLTHLANKALLDYKIMLKYLKQLEREGHVIVNSKVYITEKGKVFLVEYERLKNLVSSSSKN
ncbi:MAG: winged helix-turn-helix domain-containing protein [Fervidicoccaceae archaeon]|jgi:predicted transcriptional regulator